jgi:hypothetical protein
MTQGLGSSLLSQERIQFLSRPLSALHSFALTLTEKAYRARARPIAFVTWLSSLPKAWA